MCSYVLSHPASNFVTLWTVACKGPLEFFRKNTEWAVISPPGDLLDSGIEPHVSCIGKWISHWSHLGRAPAAPNSVLDILIFHS